jgi:hypothetical protein
MFAFKDSELLTEGKILQQQTLMRTKDAKQCSEPEPEDVEHDGTVTAARILVCAPMSLISKPRIIVARDRVLYPRKELDWEILPATVSAEHTDHG